MPFDIALTGLNAAQNDLQVMLTPQVNAMMENIGFPKEFVDPDHLDEMYNHVSRFPYF